MTQPNRISRRRLLQSGAAAASAASFGIPAVIPASALGRDGKVAPSNRITMGFIGCGNQFGNDMRSFITDERVQIVAVCDPNRESAGYWNGAVAGREPARRYIDDYYSKKAGTSYLGCTAYTDFRDLLARKDIQAVEVVTPDHWHALATIWACQAGKDVYVEKPFTLTLAAANHAVTAVQRAGVTLAVGLNRRFHPNMLELTRRVRAGADEIEVGFLLGDLEGQLLADLLLEVGRPLLRRGGYAEFPCMAPRWEVCGTGTWGTGPGWVALGDAQQLQRHQRTVARAGERRGEVGQRQRQIHRFVVPGEAAVGGEALGNRRPASRIFHL